MGRYFVAVHPPVEVLDAVAAIPRPAVDGVRWTRPDQWHVTLAFLGDVDEVAAALALRSVTAPFATVDLGPAVRTIRNDVVMIPARGLDRLADSVQAAVRPLVPDLPRRRFRGHLTLARCRSDQQPPIVGHPFAVRFMAEQFRLVSSELGPDGATHTTVERYALEMPESCS